MVITNANKNLEATAKWIDQLYDPIQSVQNNWGTYGDKTQQNIFEFDEAKGMLKHLPLNGTAPVELRAKNFYRRTVGDFGYLLWYSYNETR